MYGGSGSVLSLIRDRQRLAAAQEPCRVDPPKTEPALVDDGDTLAFREGKGLSSASRRREVIVWASADLESCAFEHFNGRAARRTRDGRGATTPIPYFPGLNAPQLSMTFHAYRADWSVSTSYETLVAKSWGYQLQQFQLALEARLYTANGNLFPYLTYSVADLSPGWHHFALTYDGATYSLWVDAKTVASAPASGDIRYYALSADEKRYDGIAIGVHSVDSALSGEGPSALFTGALSDLRLYDHALGQAELQSF